MRSYLHINYNVNGTNLHFGWKMNDNKTKLTYFYCFFRSKFKPTKACVSHLLSAISFYKCTYLVNSPNVRSWLLRNRCPLRRNHLSGIKSALYAFFRSNIRDEIVRCQYDREFTESMNVWAAFQQWGSLWYLFKFFWMKEWMWCL